MRASRPYRWFVSARVTIGLLVVLAALLLLRVALPQENVLGEEQFARIADASFANRLFLVHLGFGAMPTSPVFLAVLGLFFLNLALVIAARIGPTIRRTAVRPRSEAALDRWARVERNHVAPRPSTWDVATAARTLRGFGYGVQRSGEHSLFGVKHRTAPLGFLLFHLSFFLMCAGGAALYYTRFAGSVVLTEGQTFEGEYSDVQRQAPAGPPSGLRFTLVEVDPRLENGEPVHLGATLRIERPGGAAELRSRVNHPPRWGAATLLVNEAGLSPVFWVQDPAGYTIDRIAIPVRLASGQPTEAPLGGGATAVVFPLAPDQEFPTRDGLASTRLRILVLRDNLPAFDGTLAPGEAADLPWGTVVLEEVRYWAMVRVIHERGGGLLIAGFVLGIAGLVWRLLLHRREIGVTWDAEEVRLVGRSEYFTRRFDDEIDAIQAMLTRGAGGPTATPAAPHAGRE